MKPLLYKVNTNFFKTPLNKGFQRVLLIEVGIVANNTNPVLNYLRSGGRGVLRKVKK